MVSLYSLEQSAKDAVERTSLAEGLPAFPDSRMIRCVNYEKLNKEVPGGYKYYIDFRRCTEKSWYADEIAAADASATEEDVDNYFSNSL